MKHLLCEHQNTISELKAEGLVSTEAAQKEQKQLETVLRKKMKAIVEDTHELNNENVVKELEAVCSAHHVFILMILFILIHSISGSRHQFYT